MLDASTAPRVDTTEADPFPPRNVTRCGRIAGWAVVHTHPQAEYWAQSNLRRRGYDTYLPTFIASAPDRVTPTRRHRVTRPLFSRYLFVAIDRLWTPVRYCPGVHSLLMTDGKPAIVANAVVEAVRSALHGAKALAANQPRWEPGTPCSIVLGPLADHPAVVLSVDAHRATVAIMLFGHLREVAVQHNALVPRND